MVPQFRRLKQFSDLINHTTISCNKSKPSCLLDIGKRKTGTEEPTTKFPKFNDRKSAGFSSIQFVQVCRGKKKGTFRLLKALHSFLSFSKQVTPTYNVKVMVKSSDTMALEKSQTYRSLYPKKMASSRSMLLQGAPF